MELNKIKRIILGIVIVLLAVFYALPLTVVSYTRNRIAMLFHKG